jgi:hypothetical protein
MAYFCIILASGIPANPSNADHITAIYGDKITLNCDVNFPDGVNSPYVVQWWRKVNISFSLDYCFHFYMKGCAILNTIVPSEKFRSRCKQIQNSEP